MAAVKAETVYLEEAGAGTYEASVRLPGGARVLRVTAYTGTAWSAATSASLIVGDGTDDDGFVPATNVKATNITEGNGAYFSGDDLYSAAARTIHAKVTSVGAGATGKTRVVVEYAA